MAPTNSVNVLLMVAVALFRYSSARYLQKNDPIVPDTDAYVIDDRGPHGQRKQCDSMPMDLPVVPDFKSVDEISSQNDDADDFGRASNDFNDERQSEIRPQVSKNARLENLRHIFRNAQKDDLQEYKESDAVNDVSPGENAVVHEQETLSECTGVPSIPPKLNDVVSRILDKMCRKLRYNDPCYLLESISFELPPENENDHREFNVTLDSGRIYGMSKFDVKMNILELLLKWKELRVHYTLTIDERGKTGDTEIDFFIPLLRMHVRKPDSDSSKVEMTTVDELPAILSGPVSLPYVTERAVEHLKPRIKHIVDNELRNFLFRSFKETSEGDSHENRLQICQ